MLTDRAKTDRGAFALLYRNHVEAVHGFTHRMCGSREVARRRRRSHTPAPRRAARCSWTPGPAGTDRYVVLKSSPGETRGRVITPDPGTVTVLDTAVVTGTSYTYLVHALDASGVSLAHSNAVLVSCCG